MKSERSSSQKISKPVVSVIPEEKLDGTQALLIKKGITSSKKNVVISGGAVIYVGRIPHGFYEDEMKAYFGQFGEITRLRLSRNRVSGASKHYAFIEFRHATVARVVAETMNNYLMFNQLLQVQVVPNEKIHPSCFDGANRKFRKVPWKKLNMERFNAPRSEEDLTKLKTRSAEKKESLKKKLADLGISYDIDQIVH